MSSEKPKDVQVAFTWEPATELPIDLVDHLHVQRVGDRYFVTVGQSNFPLTPVPGEGVLNVPVRPLYRMAMRKSDLEKFVEALTKTLATAGQGS